MKAFITFEQILIALFVLAIIAAVVASGKGAQFISAGGSFLVAMVNKIQGNSGQ